MTEAKLQQPAGAQQLLDEGKLYEYGQKLKLLSNRRLQTGRKAEALSILELGASSLLERKEINGGYELLNKWLDILSQTPELLTANSAKTIIDLFNLQTTNQRGPIVEKFFRKFGRQVQPNQFLQLLSDELIRTERFYDAQTYNIHLSLIEAQKLLKQWSEKVGKTEIAAITCRYALWKLLLKKPDEAQSLIKSMPSSIFKQLAQDTYQSINIKSKQAFLSIVKAYGELLHKDPTFMRVFGGLGFHYYSVQIGSSPNMLQSFML